MNVLHKCGRRRQVCGTPQAKAKRHKAPSHAAIIDESRPPSPSRLGPDTDYMRETHTHTSSDLHPHSQCDLNTLYISSVNMQSFI